MDKIENLLPYVKLKFNIDYPMLDECYQFGFECSQASIEEEQNPFNPGTSEHDYWNDGWWDAFYGEEHRLALTNSPIENIQQVAINDSLFDAKNSAIFKKIFKITMVIAASALLSYQVLDLVA